MCDKGFVVPNAGTIGESQKLSEFPSSGRSAVMPRAASHVLTRAAIYQ